MIYVDIASSYGGGSAIARLAKWQEETGRRFEYIAKVGRPIVDARPQSTLNRVELQRELSLIRHVLGEPYAVLIKDPPLEKGNFARVLDAVQDLAATCGAKRVGLVSHDIFSLEHVDVAANYIAVVPYNGVLANVSARAVSSIAKHGWEVWAMQTLSYGFLGSKYIMAPQNRTDWRTKILPLHVATLRSGARAFLKAMRPYSDQHPVAVVALAFVLSDANVSRVIIGPRRVPHVDDAMESVILANDPSFRASCNKIRDHLIISRDVMSEDPNDA
jgi:aryl-alcohol dehydrogenase-like predicted oxidoreductase